MATSASDSGEGGRGWVGAGSAALGLPGSLGNADGGAGLTTGGGGAVAGPSASGSAAGMRAQEALAAASNVHTIARRHWLVRANRLKSRLAARIEALSDKVIAIRLDAMWVIALEALVALGLLLLIVWLTMGSARRRNDEAPPQLEHDKDQDDKR